MNELSDPRFFPANMEINLQETKFSASALVSAFGICRLIFPIGLKQNHSRAQVEFDDFTAKVLLVRQHTENGTSYGARFTDLSDGQVEYLRARVAREGAPPAWVRRFPRILVSSLRESANPHPSHCGFNWQSRDQHLSVVNFTVDGLRLLGAGDLPGLRVGAPLTISVYTSAGTQIPGLEAEVKNFSVFTDPARPTTEIGLRFTDTRTPAKESYRSLIRDCVISLNPRKP